MCCSFELTADSASVRAIVDEISLFTEIATLLTDTFANIEEFAGLGDNIFVQYVALEPQVDSFVAYDETSSTDLSSFIGQIQQSWTTMNSLLSGMKTTIDVIYILQLT